MALLVGGFSPVAHLTISARLLARDGSPLAGATVPVETVSVPPAEGGEPADGLRRLFTVITPPGRPGDYLLRVAAGDGEHEVVSLLPVTLVGPAS